VAKFFSRGALKIIILDDIFDNLTRRDWLIVKKIGNCNSGRNRLLFTKGFLFLLFVILSSLLLVFLGLASGV
jgi:hypothetical protein